MARKDSALRLQSVFSSIDFQSVFGSIDFSLCRSARRQVKSQTKSLCYFGCDSKKSKGRRPSQSSVSISACPRFISREAREIGSTLPRLSLLPLIDEHHVARLDAARGRMRERLPHLNVLVSERGHNASVERARLDHRLRMGGGRL